MNFGDKIQYLFIENNWWSRPLILSPQSDNFRE